jgi:hypothetical protein
LNYIFIINGSGTSGKDTVVDFVRNNFSKYFNIYNVSSIDKVREAAKLLGWTGSKDETDREFLHQLKMIASKFYNHSLLYMLSSLKDFESPYICFFHVREPKEIEIFKESLLNSPTPVFTILIQRNNNKVFSNDADSNVKNYRYDYIIDNNGSKYDLECKVVKLFNKILEGTFNG